MTLSMRSTFIATKGGKAALPHCAGMTLELTELRGRRPDDQDGTREKREWQRREPRMGDRANHRCGHDEYAQRRESVRGG